MPRNKIINKFEDIPFAAVSKFGHFHSFHDASVNSAVYEYLAIDSGGNVYVNSRCAIAAWLECFQEKPSWCQNEQVFQGRKSVKHFERSNGLDTALYKNVPLPFYKN